MAWWTRNRPADALQRREALLAGIPVKNSLVRETRGSGGQQPPLRLTAPLKESGLARALGRNATKKSFDLDELGAFVWDSADGRRTVEGVIRHFAAEKRVNVREAEVAVLAFLKMLAKRNLLALAVEDGAGKRQGRRKTEREQS